MLYIKYPDRRTYEKHVTAVVKNNALLESDLISRIVYFRPP